MLIGEYKHTIDPKKRVALPAKFRKELGRKVVITHGLDNCLFVYPMASWKRVAEGLAKMGVGASDMRSFNRFILADHARHGTAIFTFNFLSFVVWGSKSHGYVVGDVISAQGEDGCMDKGAT